MKKFISCLFFTLGILCTSFSSMLLAREITIGHKAVIEKINLEDHTINLIGETYILTPEIRVLTKQNQLVSVSTLRKGTIIEFISHHSTNSDKDIITQIKILSDVPKELVNH